MKKLICFGIFLMALHARAQNFTTAFEKSNGNQTATYFECIKFYTNLKTTYKTISFRAFDTTDAGYPLHLVLFSSNGDFNPTSWHQQGKIVVLINNGIHPGEPDGIDASMMLLRDLAIGKVKSMSNVVFAVIPVYNIGGSLNRGSFSRVNQNGPESYGFRGNAQNLDLNRDFIKSDSRDARAFARIFQWLQPDIFIDNHVSDGADYQHTMTMLTTQHNKLGGETGKFLHSIFEPALYKGMKDKQWDMCPYVNFEEGNPDKGWAAYYDPPRYSSGYAALFQAIAFVPETHMLKPYPARVKSTYDFMQTIMEQASAFSKDIIAKRQADIAAVKQQRDFVVSWQVDTSKADLIPFKGYATGTKISDVTGMPRMFYDHTKPFEREVKFFNTFKPVVTVEKPLAYIIPQGWHAVIDLLKLNGVALQRLQKDTSIQVDYYHIDDYKSQVRPYEKHHRNTNVKVSTQNARINFLKGDYIIYTGQRNDRYIVETLEPQGDDSFFSWNFFDAILQQKEGYSAYRWEDVAGPYILQHPELKQQLEEKKKTDPQFAASAALQLDFVYKHSPYYEPAHLRYPVFKVR
ncbi:MAG: M14 family metallopeptidase [Filimonas sp.]|nr:M14 family metallopeptidase [Filimonas sp.]